MLIMTITTTEQLKQVNMGIEIERLSKIIITNPFTSNSPEFLANNTLPKDSVDFNAKTYRDIIEDWDKKKCFF